MTAKHTPGRWQFVPLTWRGEPTSDGLGYIRPQDEDGKEICHHGDMDRPGDENRANGLLIAAAPDMLEALKNIENDGNQVPPHAWALIQAAIAKAEGGKP